MSGLPALLFALLLATPDAGAPEAGAGGSAESKKKDDVVDAEFVDVDDKK